MIDSVDQNIGRFAGHGSSMKSVASNTLVLFLPITRLCREHHAATNSETNSRPKETIPVRPGWPRRRPLSGVQSSYCHEGGMQSAVARWPTIQPETRSQQSVHIDSAHFLDSRADIRKHPAWCSRRSVTAKR